MNVDPAAEDYGSFKRRAVRARGKRKQPGTRGRTVLGPPTRSPPRPSLWVFERAFLPARQEPAAPPPLRSLPVASRPPSGGLSSVSLSEWPAGPGWTFLGKISSAQPASTAAPCQGATPAARQQLRRRRRLGTTGPGLLRRRPNRPSRWTGRGMPPLATFGLWHWR